MRRTSRKHFAQTCTKCVTCQANLPWPAALSTRTSSPFSRELWINSLVSAEFSPQSTGPPRQWETTASVDASRDAAIERRDPFLAPATNMTSPTAHWADCRLRSRFLRCSSHPAGSGRSSLQHHTVIRPPAEDRLDEVRRPPPRTRWMPGMPRFCHAAPVQESPCESKSPNVARYGRVGGGCGYSTRATSLSDRGRACRVIGDHRPC